MSPFSLSLQVVKPLETETYSDGSDPEEEAVSTELS